MVYAIFFTIGVINFNDYIYIYIRGEKVHLTLGTKCLFEKKKPKPYSINEEGDLNTGFPLFLIKEIRQCH